MEELLTVMATFAVAIVLFIVTLITTAATYIAYIHKKYSHLPIPPYKRLDVFGGISVDLFWLIFV